MTLIEAQAKIEAKLAELSTPLKEAGLTVVTRLIYADKTLREYSEFNTKCIIVLGDIAIGTDDIERDDYCNYSMCCEIKTGMVNDEELEKEINDLEGEIFAFQQALEKCDGNHSKLICDITRKQEAEAEEEALKFSKEMNKLRIKMLIGIGIIIAIIAAVIVGIPLLSSIGA